MKGWSIAVVFLCVALAGALLAGENPNAKIAVHVMTHNAKLSCSSSFPNLSDCDDIVYTVESQDVDCFPVFFDLSEFLGCEYGMSWPGAYSAAFTSCSDLTIGGIVDPGDGVAHTWTECQNEDIAIPGWAWIYEPDSATVCIVQHPLSFGIRVLDCSEGLDGPKYDPYCAGIAGDDGDDPCGYPTVTKNSTWGSVKSIFR